ncbi:hypothetical protein GQ457_08G026500 [Hibiscus cannabinus]
MTSGIEEKFVDVKSDNATDDVAGTHCSKFKMYALGFMMGLKAVEDQKDKEIYENHGSGIEGLPHPPYFFHQYFYATARGIKSIRSFEMSSKDLNLVPNLEIPPKFKMPEFEKFDGNTCLTAHITMFCRKMTGFIENNGLLIHYFQDSLAGPTSRWYNQLTRDHIKSWKYLAKAFTDQCSHITPMFIRTLKGVLYDQLISHLAVSFADIVMTGECIEDTVRKGKIDNLSAFRKSKATLYNRCHNVKQG